MRIKIEFTINLNAEQYAYEYGMDIKAVREQIKSDAQELLLDRLRRLGIEHQEIST